MTRSPRQSEWLKALEHQGLDVKSARDALQVKGWLDTGSHALNWAISGRLLRGYPLGHTVEIFGDPGTGKSFLITRALAMVQQAGGVALLDDTEGAYNLEHSALLGVDIVQLAYCRSHTVKNHLCAAQAFIKSYSSLNLKCPAVLAVDSLAQLSTEHELTTQLDKKDMTKAAELKAFFRIIGADLFDLPAVHLSTNHTIAAIGNMFNKRTTPGGGGPKFAASIRLDMRTVSKIRAGADYAGVICTIVVDKNRITAPWKKVQLAIPFNQPISRASGLVPLLVGLGVLEEKGQTLYYRGDKVGRSFKSKERFFAQDEAGEQILDQYPEILEETDKALETGQLHSATPVTEAVDDDEEDE